MKPLMILIWLGAATTALTSCTCDERCSDARLTLSISPGGPTVTSVELVAIGGETVAGRVCDDSIDCAFVFDGPLPGGLENESAPQATLRLHTAAEDLETIIVWSMDDCDVLRPVGVVVSGPANAAHLDVSEGASCRER